MMCAIKLSASSGIANSKGLMVSILHCNSKSATYTELTSNEEFYQYNSPHLASVQSPGTYYKLL